MRHLRSILYTLVLAPGVWILCGLGLTQDGSGAGSAWAPALLVLSGAAYAILLLAPISPLGPVTAGVVFLGFSLWALIAPGSYASIWPDPITEQGYDLSRPGYAVALLLTTPLLCTGLSAPRWARYEPPHLPLIGTLGLARGAASVPEAPVAEPPADVVTTGDPTEVVPTEAVAAAGEPTEVVPTEAVAAAGEPTEVMPIQAVAAAGEPTEVMPIQAVAAAGEPTEVVPTEAVAAAGEPTEVMPTQAVAAAGEPTEVVPTTVTAVDSYSRADSDSGAPTVNVEAVDEPAVTAEAAEAATADDGSAANAAVTAAVVGQPSEESAVVSPVEEDTGVATAATDAAAGDGTATGEAEEVTAAEASTSTEEDDTRQVSTEPVAEAPAEERGEAATDQTATAVDEEPTALVAAAADEETAVPVAAATESAGRPVADSDSNEKTQVIRIPSAVPNEVVTRDLRDAVQVRITDEGTRVTAPGEQTQVIRWPSGDAERVRAAAAQAERDRIAQEQSRQAFRDLAAQERARQAFAERAAREARSHGEETQVIDISAVRGQGVRPDPAEPPGERTQMLSFPLASRRSLPRLRTGDPVVTTSIVGEERPNPAADPTTRLRSPHVNGEGGRRRGEVPKDESAGPDEDSGAAVVPGERMSGVLGLERPADELAADETRRLIPPQRTSREQDEQEPTRR